MLGMVFYRVQTTEPAASGMPEAASFLALWDAAVEA